MGFVVDLENVSSDECEQILRVIRHDFLLRENDRFKLRAEEADLREEMAKSRMLAKCENFNENSCIRCLQRFSIFFKRKRLCAQCKFYVCKNCSDFDKDNKAYICSLCVRQREFVKRCHNWFYSPLHRKFTRCGGAVFIKCLYEQHVSGDCTSENAPDNVRQWLQLITDENSLSSQDFLSTSDAYSCPDTSTVSQNTLHAQEEVESVVAAECSKDSARQHPATAAEDKNLTGSLDDNAQQFAVAHSVYHELALGHEMNGAPATADCSRSNVGVLHLAGEVSQMQSKMSSAASRLLQSADMMSLLYGQLDEMDSSLDNLQVEVSDIAEGDELWTAEDQSTSEEAVSKVTAAACQLLSSAKDALHEDDISQLQLPSLEKFGNRMPQNVKPDTDLSTEPALQPEDATSDVVKPNDDQNEETSLEDIEAKIYVNSSELFLLEERIHELEKQVLSLDENSACGTITDLENKVALTVAMVSHRDDQVSDVEHAVWTTLGQRHLDISL